jgi:hypothetical protein
MFFVPFAWSRRRDCSNAEMIIVIEAFRCGPALDVPKMIEAEFFFELPVRLLADPARLDGADEGLGRRVDRLVRQVLVAFAIRATLADRPDFFARHVPPPTSRMHCIGRSATRTRTAANRVDWCPSCHDGN